MSSGFRVSFDASDVDNLVGELRRVPAVVEKRNRDTVHKSINDVTKGWVRRATSTAGKHGKLYPKAIKSETLAGGLEAVTGPLSSMPQGDMGPGFEWGHPTTIRNPGTGKNKGGWFIGGDGKWHPGGFLGQRVGQDTPHLDMTITMDEQEPKFIESAAEDLVPWW